MTKYIEEIPLLAVKINFTSNVPLYKQLYDSIKKSIIDGKLTVGQKLPATRSVAYELKISRHTVITAFQQLLIEGYIKGKRGSGTYVNDIPKDVFNTNGDITQPKSGKKIVSKLDKHLKYSLYYRNAIAPEEIFPFQISVPLFEDFPIKTWVKLNNKAIQIYSDSHLRYSDAAGYKPLREEIAKYLRTYRAVNCNAEQIIIVGGSQQGLNLIAKVLVNSGNPVAVEDPGYFGFKWAMDFAGAKICPVPLDKKGLDVKYLSKNYKNLKLIFTTPSCHYPLGLTMDISRRIELLQYAYKNNCWIIEDDYDSELRYVGNPFPSLQGMDKNNSVIYIGTFSKVLFPGLRLGYLVVTEKKLYDLIVTAKLMTDFQNPVFEQIITYLFLKDAHFTVHIRKMRILYKARQEFLIDQINKELSGLLKVNETPAGMHVLGWLPPNVDDKKITEEARKNKIVVFPLSASSIKFYKGPGLIMGYTSFNRKQITEGIKKLKKILIENTGQR